MSSVSTGCRPWCSDPCSRAATWPHTVLSARRVSGSLIPGRITHVPAQSSMARAPSLPHRLRSWASPWTTGIIWIPLPPESASHSGSGTGQTWQISSRAKSMGLGSRPFADQLPTSPAV